jgi:hypothetical protein
MTPHEVNTWALFLIVGIPCLVVIGGGLVLHMALALAALALFFSHPALAIALGALWLLRKPLRWFVAALFVGEGLRTSGVFGRLSRRPRYPCRSRWSRADLRRHDEEFRRTAPRSRGEPWDDTIDVG